MVMIPSPLPRPKGVSLPSPIEWMLLEGRNITEGPVFFAALCERLVAAGLPLMRASFNVRVLHPQLAAINLIWRRGKEVERIERGYTPAPTEAYLQSPIRVIFEGAAALRRRLDIANPHLDFPILGELRAEGATDYVAMGVPDTLGQPAAVTWAADRPGGFSTEDLTLLFDMLPILSLVVEVHKTRNLAANMLAVYLGEQTGQRVLQGSIRRGQLDTIHAVLWYCDLRGFTAMSDALPSDELIELLNAYFEAVAGPVMARGGEVLKFIGDGILAIFPVTGGSPRGACEAALRAVSAARAGMAHLDDERRRQGLPPLPFGAALHLGEMLWGNIGAANRLGFTAIGSAVNLVSRLEGLCRPLGRTVLVSGAFATQIETSLIALGTHELRGIASPCAVFTVQDAAVSDQGSGSGP